jgi:hypothetical protein
MDAVSYSHSAKQAQRIKKIIANPDSTSGVVTVPSTIATGETITVPAGRTAILPDVVIEGDLVVDGTVFIPTGSTYTQETIKTEAISNIAGSTVVDVTDIAKSSVVTPALALKANTADLKEIGVGQTWQNVTASRTAGTTYTNSTGKPIMVVVSGKNSTGNDVVSILVDGVAVNSTRIVATSYSYVSSSAIVPNNSTYSVAVGTDVLSRWIELR